MEYPHFLRNISRTFGKNFGSVGRMLCAVLILGIFIFYVFVYLDSFEQVKGTRDENNDALVSELNNTLKVVQERPDYAGAWIKLSILYEELGEDDLAKTALETAKRLNPDL